MKRHLLLWAALIVPAASFGQSPVVLKDSGLKKLAVFIGTWKAENDPDSSGVLGGSGVSAVYTCQWSANGNYLVADQQVTVGGNTTNNLSIYNYNSQKDTYTLSLVGVPGMQPFSILVTYKGDELYYLSDYTDNNGKKIYSRTVNSFLSLNSYTFKVQSSEDGEHWKTSMQGKAHRVR
jgi:Protein of unknown function (DUF1579)